MKRGGKVKVQTDAGCYDWWLLGVSVAHGWNKPELNKDFQQRFGPNL